MFERRWHALFAGAVLLVVASVLTIAVGVDPTEPVVQPADDLWMEWMLEVRTSWVARLATAVSWLGGPWVMAPVRLLVVLALAPAATVDPAGRLRRRRDHLGALHRSAQGAHRSTAPGRRVGVGRIGRVPVRPHDRGVRDRDRAGRRVRPATAPPHPVDGRRGLLRPADGDGRTYLGVHWATDVVAGACIGTGLAVAWPAALELGRSRWRVGAVGAWESRWPPRRASRPSHCCRSGSAACWRSTGCALTSTRPPTGSASTPSDPTVR